MKNTFKECIGELTGTFILVLFGCGAIGGAVILGAFNSLFEVALIWGLGVCIAIFATRSICPAHLNPAVSFAMLASGKLGYKRFFLFVISQLLGAIIASCSLYILFDFSISNFELKNNIIRGEENSFITAQIFGEFFPNPSFSSSIEISWIGAMLTEAFGTMILVFMIFKLTEREEKIDNSTPLLIGLSVSIIICLIAPFTQAGINPARDLGPRLFAYFAGWGKAAFPNPPFSFFTVYIIGPFIGAYIAVFLQKSSNLNSYN